MFNKYKTTIYSYLHGCSVENINVKIENKNLNLLSTRQKQCPALIFLVLRISNFLCTEGKKRYVVDLNLVRLNRLLHDNKTYSILSQTFEVCLVQENIM